MLITKMDAGFGDGEGKLGRGGRHLDTHMVHGESVDEDGKAEHKHQRRADGLNESVCSIITMPYQLLLLTDMPWCAG